MFEKVGGPISQPEFDYVVYMAMEAQKAGLKDELNDFEEDEEWPIEIHEAWAKLGYPTSFKAFQTAQKGKARAISPAPPKSKEPSLNAPSTSADQLTGSVSEVWSPQGSTRCFLGKSSGPGPAFLQSSQRLISWSQIQATERHSEGRSLCLD
jgi:hypothetical protein